MSLKKKWMDDNIVPLLKENSLEIHSFIWEGNPPKEVLVWLRTFPFTTDKCTRCHLRRGEGVRGIECALPGCTYGTERDPLRWASTIKNLLEAGWRFDFTREQVLVVVNNQNIKAFGGDGAPLFSPEGLASVRLFQKTEDGVGLIIQIGCHFWETPDHESPGKMAAAAVKGFFALFETDNPMEVCAKYAVPFGAQ
jgi:hypothetical protein